MLLRAPIVLLTGLLFACSTGDGTDPDPRQPGPHPSEWEFVTYWHVEGSEVTWEACSDLPDWRAQFQPPELNNDAHLAYMVASDGLSATIQTCQTTDPRTCTQSPAAPVYIVDGHALVWSEPERLDDIPQTTCDRRLDTVWTVTDKGDSATLEVATFVSLVTDPAACKDYDAALEVQSPNGVGGQGCIVRRVLDLGFVHAL